MTDRYRIAIAVLLGLNVNVAYAYNSGQGASSSCVKPTYSEFQPAPNKYIQSFNEFSLQVSANTVPTSINVNVSSGNLKFHFTSKELQIAPLKNGHLEVKGKLNRPIEHGFVRVSITSHVKQGCDITEGYLLRIY